MASCSVEVKKKNRGVWLVGGTIGQITGSKLPSNKQVLQRFFHLHKNDKKTIQESAINTAREILIVWEKAKIPTRQECHIINKIKQLHSTWQGLKKSASRRTEVQQGKEEAFVQNFDDLFDAAHADALTLINIDEDRQFLLAQREKGRRGCMGPVDTKLAQQEVRRLERAALNAERQRKEVARCAAESQPAELSDSSNEETIQASSSDEEVSVNTSHLSPKRRKPTSIVNSEVSAALDRSKVSDRNAVYVLAATAHSLGQDPQNLAINRESIRQARRKTRETIAKEIKDSFTPGSSLTVHWDGKMLPALQSKESVDRLAILVSGEGTTKLLGVPKIPSGTGEAQAMAVFSLIQEWNLNDRVQFMSFDTTASNTGLKSGACILLEQKLGRKLVSLACRHHVMELIVAKVFDKVMEASSGPNIKLFKRFSEFWTSIDRHNYESGVADHLIASQLESEKDVLLAFISSQLSQFQPRDDYRELLQLAQLFLGADLRADVTIHQPGALHRARWMAKLIYSLKIFLFRSQFKLTERELSGLRRFNVFLMKVYLKTWFTCQCPTSAPRNDLSLLRNIEAYKTLDASVATAAMKSFSNHLWYLSETLIGLAFFDADVSVDEKIDMVRALQRQVSSDDPPRRIACVDNQTALKKLSDFVSSNTRKFFVALGANDDFLQEHPNTWDTNDGYIQAQTKARQLKVVNDAAERGVALCQSFNAVLTNQEEQKQFLLQIVEKHRLDFPDSDKSTVVRKSLKN